MKQIIVDNQVTSYFITEDGKCYNSKTNNYLKGQFSNSGYLNYNLSITPTYKKRLYAHRLVAQYFLNDGKPIPVTLEVNHKDGDKTNNVYSNLELISHKNNILHAVKYDLKETKDIYCFDDNLEVVKRYKNLQEVLKQNNFSDSVIRQEVCSNKKKKTYGFYWSYKPSLTKEEIITFQNTGKAKAVYQYTLDEKLIAEYPSTAEAARQNFPTLKRASSHIGECCRGRIKTYKKYLWKYKDDIV